MNEEREKIRAEKDRLEAKINLCYLEEREAQTSLSDLRERCVHPAVVRQTNFTWKYVVCGDCGGYVGVEID